MEGFSKVKNEYVNKNFDFSVDEIRGIIGSSKLLQKMYKSHEFDTEMLLSTGNAFDTKYVGKLLRDKPSCVINLFKLTAHLYERYLVTIEDDSPTCITMMSISSEGSKISVEAFSVEDSCAVIGIEESSSGLVVVEGKKYLYNDSGVEEFLDLLIEVVNYYNKISPVPIFCAEYWLRMDKYSIEDIGCSDTYLVGFSEAHWENGAAGITCDEDCIPGEYTVAILEMV